MKRKFNTSFFVIVCSALLFSACSALQPVNLPPEYTPPPAEAALWEEIDSIRPGNWLVPLNSGVEALDWRLTAIDSATESIDLQTFLWDFDTVGAMVLDHLIAAADRNVTVHILIDDTFLAGQDEMLLALHKHPNIEYRVFNPFKRRADALVKRQILNLAEFHRLDHRMHNKAMVIDDQVAIVGGRNLADEYFGLHSETNFRDMELLVGGPIVQKITDSFDAYWNDQWSIPIDMLSHVKASPLELDKARQVREAHAHLHVEESHDERLRRWQNLAKKAFSGRISLLVDKPPRENPAQSSSAPVQLANELTTLFDNAQEEILIISAYLIPTPYLEGTIEQAFQRNVKVFILTNSIRSNNHLAAHSAYRNHIQELMRNGAKLHEVRIDARERRRYMLPPTDKKSLALHAKVLVIDDDKVFIGSANLDPRSLKINTEMGLLVESKALNAEIRSYVEPDFSIANAWHLQFDDDGEVVWVSEGVVLTSQPAESFMQRIEDWFLSHLPIEDEM